MSNPFSYADYEQAAASIQGRISTSPTVGLVLGSGLGELADTLQNATTIPYADIPHFPASTVHGHRGELVIGELDGVVVVCQRGRAHFYEGYHPQQITFPIRVMYLLGAKTLVLTNAAGGVNRDYNVGDVMVLNDHINFIGMAGANPLVGPNVNELGERFIGMSQTYDRHLRAAAREAAQVQDLPVHEGVYFCLAGPIFETPAEIRAIRMMGADAVGMSTAHEVLVARHAGMRVLAMSGITNRTIDQIDTEADTNHEEVLEAGKLIVPRMTAILRGVLQSLANGAS